MITDKKLNLRRNIVCLEVFQRTRIAPTPSGYLHVGNVLSFAITAGLARKTGAKILLRIDDMDRGRVQPEYIQDIFDTLDFMEIPWDEGPRNVKEFEQEWSQMRRLGLYNQALEQLKTKGDVYACTCSRAQLRRVGAGETYPGTCREKQISLDTPETNWRLFTNDSEIRIKTLTGIVDTKLPDEVKDFVIRKKDGFPAYQLSSVIDDLHFGVDLVVRGEDLWASTVAQHYLATILEENVFLNSTFYHHQLLLENAGTKLSKSAGSTSIKFMRDQGKKAADIYNMIASALGNSGIANNYYELFQLIEIPE